MCVSVIVSTIGETNVKQGPVYLFLLSATSMFCEELGLRGGASHCIG